MKRLITTWGEGLNPRQVKQEYPRPNLVRNSYVNLNGPWECRVEGEAGEERFAGSILVPFSPEAALSGVERVLQPDEVLRYRKAFALPQGFQGERVLLHFGAVDQECAVFLNGQALGGHRGGYLPFSFDVTEALAEGENVLEVRARDRTEHAPYARGKQKLVRKGKYGSIFYTPNSGIWKTVWMESVPARHVTGLRFTPRYDDAQIEIELSATAPGRAKLVISLEEQTVYQGEISVGEKTRVDLPGFLPWSPDAPHLYDVEITLGSDRVRSYFGMRCFEAARDPKGVLRFFLNKKPFFFNGLLDQGYWSDGLLTAPSDEALKHDICVAKSLGYNTIRKHVKVEEERFYYLCDKIGMAVWQDMPNGGGEYNMFFVTELPNSFDWFARSVKDHWYHAFKRADREGREQFGNELGEMVRLLYNYPCIALWTPFNEGWGQFDAKEATKKILAADSTRLINEACGWFDQGGGDVYSIHNYRRALRVKPQRDRVVAVTEYGGYAYGAAGHVSCEKEFGYRSYASQRELTQNYERLWEEEILPNLECGLSGAIYTQISDVEEEINGVMTFDRALVKLEEEPVQALNRRLYAAFKRLTE